MSKVEIRPIERKKWHNKRGKESFTQPHTIQALVDAERRVYSVSLGPKRLKELEDITRYDLSLIYNTQTPHPFWDSNEGKIKLENRTMFIDPSIPLNEIKLGILKASRFVANTYQEYEEGLYPDATHYIHDEREDAELKASKIELKSQAIIKASKLSSDRKVDIIKVLTGGTLKNQSANFLTVEINKLIEADASLFLKTLEKSSKETSTLALVYDALDKGVLRKDGHNIKYLDSVLGTSEEEVAEYFMDDKNQEFTLLIKDKSK